MLGFNEIVEAIGALSLNSCTTYETFQLSLDISIEIRVYHFQENTVRKRKDITPASSPFLEKAIQNCVQSIHQGKNNALTLEEVTGAYRHLSAGIAQYCTFLKEQFVDTNPKKLNKSREKALIHTIYQDIFVLYHLSNYFYTIGLVELTFLIKPIIKLIRNRITVLNSQPQNRIFVDAYKKILMLLNFAMGQAHYKEYIFSEEVKVKELDKSGSMNIAHIYFENVFNLYEEIADSKSQDENDVITFERAQTLDMEYHLKSKRTLTADTILLNLIARQKIDENLTDLLPMIIRLIKAWFEESEIPKVLEWIHLYKTCLDKCDPYLTSGFRIQYQMLFRAYKDVYRSLQSEHLRLLEKICKEEDDNRSKVEDNRLVISADYKISSKFERETQQLLRRSKACQLSVMKDNEQDKIVISPLGRLSPYELRAVLRKIRIAEEKIKTAQANQESLGNVSTSFTGENYSAESKLAALAATSVAVESPALTCVAATAAAAAAVNPGKSVDAISTCSSALSSKVHAKQNKKALIEQTTSSSMKEPIPTLMDESCDAKKLGFNESLFGNATFFPCRRRGKFSYDIYLVYLEGRGSPLPPKEIEEEFKDQRFKEAKIATFKGELGFKWDPNHLDQDGKRCAVLVAKDKSIWRMYPDIVETNAEGDIAFGYGLYLNAKTGKADKQARNHQHRVTRYGKKMP